MVERGGGGERLSIPLLGAVAVVALTLGGLLAGYEPVSGDPDCLYRPIKSELARALGHGTLPFWSDRFGLGVPLVAESHAAAFYPPNWLFYRVFDVSTAYRLAMWLHYLALVVATYGYARVLGITPWGAALAAIALALSGFQMSHSCHEPFYHLLPYLPLALMLAERYLATGEVVNLALLALAVGAQFTLGHFQIQTWTAGLVVLTGAWRCARRQAPWARAAGLVGGLAWAGAVASVQLLLTWDLTRASNFDRPIQFMSLYPFPITQLAQLALPRLFMGWPEGGKSLYWRMYATSADEACLYVGTVPLILAACGLVAKGDRALTPWRWLTLIGVVLSTMQSWFPEGYRVVLLLPIFGHFRAPGRYTLLTTVGLCLLAGRGFDRAMARRRFWSGYALAGLVGAASFAWALYWITWPETGKLMGPGRAEGFVVRAAAVWGVSLVAVALWRVGRVSPWVPFLTAACELAYLYHHGTTPWGWSVAFPRDSPVFRTLSRQTGVGLVGGDLQDVAVRAGLTTAYPNLGIIAPPPNYLLELSGVPRFDADLIRMSKRYGVTHGVFDGPTKFRISENLYVGPDAALDAMLPGELDTHLPRIWRVERYDDIFPEARTARKVRVGRQWPAVASELLRDEDQDKVVFLEKDVPPDDPPGPRARSARVVEWAVRPGKGRGEGKVEHDGTVDLVLRRTYVEGWVYRLDDGPERPVTAADGGLQSVRVFGSGVTRVRTDYRPVWLARGAAISLTAVLAALAVVGSWARRRRILGRSTG